MSIHLESKNLINAQQMEVAVNGPDGATHLILCTGVADLGFVGHETYTFLVGPQISRRQFVGAIASGALSMIQGYDRNASIDNAVVERGANLVLIDANYDDESGQVKVSAKVSLIIAMTKVAISYNVSILVELPISRTFGRKGNYLIVTIILTQFTDEIRLGGYQMIRIQKLSSK